MSLFFWWHIERKALFVVEALELISMVTGEVLFKLKSRSISMSEVNSTLISPISSFDASSPVGAHADKWREIKVASKIFKWFMFMDDHL